MLRTARKITPLLSSLLFGVAGITAVTASSAVLIGCEDENKPEYHIKRLDDLAMRPSSVKRLQQFFEDAMTRADKNRADPQVKELLDKMVPPLTKTYMEASAEDRTKGEILKLLADTRDVRAKEAWIKALKDYQPNLTEDQIKAAVRAIEDTKVTDDAAMDAIVAAFLKLEAGSAKGGLIWMDFKEAMSSISSPRWKDQLIERLNRPMEMVTAEDRNNEDKIRSYRNEQFWQITAAEILGNIKAAEAVKPLFKTIIDPNKADVAATSVVALVKTGKPASNMLFDALLGKDAEVLEYAKAVVKNKAEVEVTPIRSAAIVIGTMGRSDGVKPLMLALDKVDKNDQITRAILAREIAKLPATPESTKATLQVLEAMPVSATIPPGMQAVAVLTEQLGMFYDPSLVDVLIKRGNDAKGEPEDKAVVRDSAMATMIKLMKKEQIEAVEKAIKDWAPKENEAKLEKEALSKAKALLNACGDKVECYLAKIEEPAVQEKDQQFTGIKAAYMLGILGNQSTAMEIAKRLPKIKNAAIKYAAGQALDFLTPNGDKELSAALKKTIDDNIAKGDRNMILGDAPIRQIMYRLDARL